MKFLFLVASILKNWFTTYRKYTLTVIAAMTLSVLALFFIAEKAASENLESLYLIRYEKARYFMQASSERYFAEDHNDEKYPGLNVKVDYDFLDGFVNEELPEPMVTDSDEEFPYGIRMTATKINGDKDAAFPFVSFGGIPVFSDSERDKYGKMATCFDGYKYTIIDGRDISEQALEEKRAVAVVDVDSYDNRYGVTPEIKVGDVLGCGAYEVTVIGLCEYTGEGNYESCYSRIPFYLSDECMKHYKGFGHNNVDVPMSAAGLSSAGLGKIDPDELSDAAVMVVSYPEYDIMCSTVHIVFEHPLTSKEYKSLLKITGLSENEVTNDLYKGLEKRGMDKYIKTTFLSGTAFAIFCALNIVSVIWFLLKQNMLTFRIFRVYGARDKLIFRIILFLVGVLVVISGLLAFALSPLTMIVYNKLLTGYEYRFLCFFSAFGIMLVINILAAVPTALLVIKRSPVGK